MVLVCRYRGLCDHDCSKDYVDTCHAKDIEVWALFSNEFPSDDGTRYFDSEKTDQVLAYTSKREKVISEVISYVTKYGIDGINIDFELISQEGADDYIEFIRELSIACRANNIILSVDNYVPEYTYYYNRREQGIVADYVVIMGYVDTCRFRYTGACRFSELCSQGYHRYVECCGQVEGDQWYSVLYQSLVYNCRWKCQFLCMRNGGGFGVFDGS